MEKQFTISGMTCAACASSVESILHQTEGVTGASVNFANNSVLLEYNESVTPNHLQNAVRSVGYNLIINNEDPEEIQHKYYIEIRNRTIWSSILTLPVFILGMFIMDWVPGRWISLVFTIPVLFWFGRSFFINAYKQARHGKANMDTLVALSTGIAFIFSLFNTLFPDFWFSRGITPHVYYEAAAVIITFISLGKVLEEKAKSKTSSASKKHTF